MRTKDIHNKTLAVAMSLTMRHACSLVRNTVCKVKAKMSLCSIMHHDMKTYGGNKGVAPYIPDGEWSA